MVRLLKPFPAHLFAETPFQGKACGRTLCECVWDHVHPRVIELWEFCHIKFMKQSIITSVHCDPLHPLAARVIHRGSASWMTTSKESYIGWVADWTPRMRAFSASLEGTMRIRRSLWTLGPCQVLLLFVVHTVWQAAVGDCCCDYFDILNYLCLLNTDVKTVKGVPWLWNLVTWWFEDSARGLFKSEDLREQQTYCPMTWCQFSSGLWEALGTRLSSPNCFFVTITYHILYI